MTKDFCQRFKIPIDLAESQRRFVNRAQNLLFNELLYRIDEHYVSREKIRLEVATTLGEYHQGYTDPAQYTKGDFIRTLHAIEGFYRAAPMYGGEIEGCVRRLIEESEVNLSIRWQDGRFFPEGAPFLDEKLVNDVLGQLGNKDLKAVLEPFQKGIRHLLDSAQRPDLRADVITDMYEALEALAQFVTGRPEKDLSANRELFIKQVKASDQYKELLKVYIEYANDFRHAATASKPRPSISLRETESFVYLTGLFIRLAITPGSDS